MIPFFDLSRQIQEVRGDLEKSFSKSLETARFIGGEPLASFEKDLCSYFDVRHAIGVSSGTDALLASFMGLGLKPGDEILVTSFTFAASATSILRAGLNPVFVDLEKNQFYPSVENYKKAWTNKTKGILVVHLFGEALDLHEISLLCKERDAYLIEDCAQSFGSKHESGKMVGTTGDISAFSFFPAKNLGCLGDGGAVITDNDELADTIRAIKTHGCSKVKYQHDLLGGNFRLDTIQASFLSIMLKKIDHWVEKRKLNAKFYYDNLTVNDNMLLPNYAKGNSYNQFTIRTKYRDELKKHLDYNKIGNMIYYPQPLHKQRVFSRQQTLKNAELACSEVLSIPIYPHLKRDEQEMVVEKINQFMEKK